MKHTIKTFLLGVGTAYLVYYLTRKRADGRSILDEMLDEPEVFIHQLKDRAISEALRAIRKTLR